MKPRGTVGFSFLLPTWLREPLLSIGVAKEVREIFPYWLVSAAVSALWLAGGGGSLDEGMAFVSFLVGELATMAMGAAMFGHEFTHRTVSLMLVQPVARRELWQRKMAVLGAAMGVPLLLRLAGPILHGNALTTLSFAGLMSVSAILYGLTVAPWLTLVSRSVLAGTVFTACLPVITYQATSVAVALAYGLDVSNASAMPATLSVFALLTVLQWIVAPFLGYRAFRRLQATDSPGTVIRLPRLLRRTQATAIQWLAAPLLGYRAFLRMRAMESRGTAIRLPRLLRRTQAPTATVRRPGGAWAKLIGKELRLLAPAYVVAGLYVLVCGADIAIRLHWPAASRGEYGSDLVRISSVIFGIIISLLAGCLACAEERHLGTLPWQLVQPVAAWRQWLVKAGVALAVSLVLGLGLPVLMFNAERAFFWTKPIDYPALVIALVVLNVVLLTLLGLYVSSVANSTIQAMLWATPIAVGLEASLWGTAAFQSYPGGIRGVLPQFLTDGSWTTFPAGLKALLLCVFLLWILLAAGLYFLPLIGAYANFRRLDQRASRVLMQLALFLGYYATGAVAFFGLALWSTMEIKALPPSPEVVQARLNADRCVQNLKAISTAITDWSLHHAGQLPPSLGALTNELASPEVLVCPADSSHHPASDWTRWTPKNVTYQIRRWPSEPSGHIIITQLGCPIHGTTTTSRAGIADPTATNAPPRIDLRMLMRYGLIPKDRKLVPRTDPKTGAETFQLVPRTNAPANGEATPPAHEE